MFKKLVKRLRIWMAKYDAWLVRNGLDSPCRSCIPREHDNQR